MSPLSQPDETIKETTNLTPEQYKQKYGRHKSIQSIVYHMLQQQKLFSPVQLAYMADSILTEYKLYYTQLTAEQLGYKVITQNEITNYKWRGLKKIKINNNVYGLKIKEAQ